MDAAPIGRRNPRIADLRRLATDPRERRRRDRVLVEGAVLVAEALSAGVTLEAVFVAEHAQDDLAALGLPPSCPVTTVTADALERVGASVTPQPLLAVASWPAHTLDDVVSGSRGPVVVAVEMSDPGNAGTIVRTAEAAGAAGVVFTTGSVDPRSPKVVRASAGSVLRLPIVDGVAVDSVVDQLRTAGVRTIAAEAHAATSLWQAELGDRFALVLGSETHGLGPEIAADVDEVVAIPMAPGVESLNVAISAAIVLFEAARRTITAHDAGTPTESDLNRRGAADNLTSR